MQNSKPKSSLNTQMQRVTKLLMPQKLYSLPCTEAIPAKNQMCYGRSGSLQQLTTLNQIQRDYHLLAILFNVIHSGHTYKFRHVWEIKIPLKWRQKWDGHGLNPVPIMSKPALQALLNFKSCQCMKGCSTKYSYRKAGLKCSVICVQCHNQLFGNALRAAH